jgi:hypothetical protein
MEIKELSVLFLAILATALSAVAGGIVSEIFKVLVDKERRRWNLARVHSLGVVGAARDALGMLSKPSRGRIPRPKVTPLR